MTAPLHAWEETNAGTSNQKLIYYSPSFVEFIITVKIYRNNKK